MVKKATEYGAVEIWMNERVRRACANSCADFMYGFLEVCYGTPILALSTRYLPDKILGVLIYAFLYLSQTSAKKGSEYWLVWKFEGESTLADLVQSKEFPYNVGTFLNNKILCDNINVS